MTFTNPDVEEGLRQTFRYFNRFMLLMWQLGLGTWFNIWPETTGRVMVIVHTGRKTGFKRRTPVNYAIVDGELYCMAGFGAVSDWYRNILAHHEVEVWLPDGWWAGVAEDVSDSPARLHLLREIIVASGFAAPLFGIHQERLSDEDLDKITAKYRLVHIRRTEPRTGSGGPGELAWVWPLSTLILLVLALSRPRRG